jgi:hypothetical protein
MNPNAFNVLWAITAVFACLFFIGVFPLDALR